ncbi:MAG: carboxypeptidase-like regulatory domain-containing protein [Saprospiraceae bacterium]
MKVFPYVFFLIFALNENSFAQVSISEKTNLTLDDALKNLSSGRKIHFAYDPNLCSKYFVNTWNNNQTTELILESLLVSTPLSFKIQDENHFLIFTDEVKLKQLEANSKETKKIQINGSIQDYSNGETIVGATIIIYPDGLITQSDISGKFIINQVSKYSKPWIEIRYLGYQNQTFFIEENNNQKLKINLIPEISLLPPIVIKSIRPTLNFERIDQSSSSIIKNLTYRIQANVFKDPMRALQQSSGVNATDDRSSGLQIRGSGTDENLIKLNGLTLFNVDHFYGVFSSINPYLVSSIDLYKSYFPANYGGRISSVVLIKSDPNITKFNGGIDLNLITANAYIKTPITKKLNIAAGARTTTFNLGESNTFNTLLQENNQILDPIKLSDSTEIVAINPKYTFNDIFVSANYNPLKKLNLNASYFSSKDAIQSQYNSSNINSSNIVGVFKDSSNWKNFASNLGGKYIWTNNVATDFNFSKSKYNFNQIIDSRIRQKNILIQELSTVVNDVDNNNFQLNTQITEQKNKINIGFEYNQYITHADILFNRLVVSQNTANNFELAGFIQTDFLLTDKLSFSPGIRISKYSEGKNLDFSPRYSMQYQWNSKWTSTLNLGIYYQYLRQARYEDRFGREYYLWIQSDGNDIPSLISNQSEFVQQFKGSNYLIKAELYYKKVDGLVDNIIEVQLPTTSNEPARIKSFIIPKGKGIYKGIDLTFEQHIKKYSYYLIYSYNNSKNSFLQIDNGKYFQRPYARIHQFKSNHSLNLDHWDFSINGVYGSSLPYNDVFISGKNTRDRKPSQQTKYLDDYLRIDLDVKYKIKLKQSQLEFGLSVLNLFDRRNTKYVQSLFTFSDQNTVPNRSQKYVVGAEVETLRRTLNLSIGYHF